MYIRHCRKRAVSNNEEQLLLIRYYVSLRKEWINIRTKENVGRKKAWYRGEKKISCLKFLSSPFRISIFRNEIVSTSKERGWKAGKYYKYYSN